VCDGGHLAVKRTMVVLNKLFNKDGDIDEEFVEQLGVLFCFVFYLL